MDMDGEKAKNIVKKIFICLIIGVIVGFIEFAFGKSIEFVMHLKDKIYFYLIFFAFIPLAITLFVKKYYKINEKSLPILLNYINTKKDTKVHYSHIIYQYVSTCISHLFGFSLGKEGVGVFFGGSVINNIFSKIDKNDKYLYTLCGMVAGFSGLFLVPIAAIFFALEITNTLKNNIKYIFYLFISSAVSFFINYYFHTHALKIHLDLIANIDILKTIEIMILSLVCGYIFVKFLSLANTFAAKIPNWIKVFLISTILSFIIFYTKDGRYSSLSTNILDGIYMLNEGYAYDFVFKIIFTILSICIGLQGGEVTPIFVIGSAIGFFIGDSGFYASLGLVCFFAICTNTFFTPLFLAFDIFGYENFHFYIIPLIFIKVLNYKNSIYINKTTLFNIFKK